MPDDQFFAVPDALTLDPPVGVPEPAPLDMPSRRINRFPVDLARLLPRPRAVWHRPQGSGAG